MTTKASGSRKLGRGTRSPSHKRYNAGKRRFWNKLARVRQSEGEEAAAEYSLKYGHRQQGPVGKLQSARDEFRAKRRGDD